jgi:hypothetical protein
MNLSKSPIVTKWRLIGQQEDAPHETAIAGLRAGYLRCDWRIKRRTKMAMITRAFILAGILMIPSVAAFPHGAMSKEEISQLPPEQVKIVKQHCLADWPNGFEMRLFCEDQQYKALQSLIDRD